MFWRHWMHGPIALLLDEEGDSGGGGGGGKPDVAAQIQGLQAKYGSAKAALAALYTENYQLREDKRGLKSELEKSGLPEGAVVLSADEAKAWEAYTELGKPEELKKAIDEKATLEKRLSDAEREKAVEAAAEAAGFKAAVLQKLPGVEDLKFEVREEKVDDEKVKVAFVTESTDGATPQKLTDYVEATWEEFLPALQDDAEEQPRGGTDIPFPKQKPAGRGGAKGAATKEDVVQRKKASRRYASL